MVPGDSPECPRAREDRAAPQVAGGDSESCRARLHQLIAKEVRIRAGAENLYRATRSARVREMVALELCRINSGLQLLREELQGLGGGSVDGNPPASASADVPLIPLGLKETRRLDWAPALKELISGHFGEDSACYEAEIQELDELRQATRTPSWSEASVEVLAAYYTQLGFLDARFSAPGRGLRLLFHWYDSITGVPVQQRALAFEKGSVLFNIGALHTQIGASQDRTCLAGTGRAVDAFQKAAGAFRLLRESFSHAPSPDLSPPWLLALERLMTAQAQECIFQGLSLQAPHSGPAQLLLAQEAAQVATEYRLVHGAMTQPALRDLVPLAWAALALVKAEHFQALAHYHATLGLCEGPVAPADLERVFAAPGTPAAASPEPEERRRLGQAHLRRALRGHERALRLHARGRALRTLDPLQAALTQALRRTLAKYSELDREDDFGEAADAPDIRPKTQQQLEVTTPSFSRPEAADIFRRLGPLPVFSARNQWRLVGPVHVTPGEGGFGFTLRGDAPVLIAAVIPGSPAAAAGLKGGDYIVSVRGQPCRWWPRAELVAQLRGVGAEGVSLQVATPLPSPEPPAMGTC
ncbi:rhophilin-1 [Sorex fumeus]|uniref:rhophilin-1 n=1 Tax=Sorex fumeus TaxID=62283 RepID=UPI0024ACE5FD|nr:rhophilin-1 [Sorex fumeus]